MKAKLLIVQSCPLEDALQRQLEATDYQVFTSAWNGGVPDFGRIKPDVILLDLAGFADVCAAVAAVRQFFPRCPLIALVDVCQSAQAGDAMRAGAVDYLLKPFTAGQLIAAAERALSLRDPIENMVVASPASQQILLLAKKAALSDASILIGGESGTGKERLAQFVHDQSPRAGGPYVAVNCAAIPETMLESTLFGFVKGAFTGAHQGQMGKFESANGGTLLLDEIAEMPLALQAKLLRVLQERELERLGSNQKIPLDVRLIAATNRDLRQEVAAGRFREDLFYRLDVFPLSWPALRHRREDIAPLVRHFLQRYSPEVSFEFHPEAMRALLAHSWPGNIRELENTIQRAVIVARGLVIQRSDLMLPDPVAPPSPAATSLESSRRSAEFQHVLETLRQFNGARRETADALGVTTRALRYKLAAMRELGIDINQFVVNG